MPTSGLKPVSGAAGGSGIGRRSTRAKPKRSRQVSTGGLRQMMLDDIDEDQATAETIPDHLSTSASEASSKGSNNSQPQLLDFIGATCQASAWFTSCFPCAVVDINENDDYVVDKLSRESAMIAMYGAGRSPGTNSITVTPEKGASKRSQADRADEREKNLTHLQLPQLDESKPATLAPIHSMPSVIVEDSDEDEAMDEISLNDDADSMPVAVVTTERVASGVMESRGSPVLLPEAAVNETPIYSPPKKKKFGMKKLFSRKKL